MSKLHVMCDGRGRSVRLLLTEGRRNDPKAVVSLVPHLPKARLLVVDKFYASHWLHRTLKQKAIVSFANTVAVRHQVPTNRHGVGTRVDYEAEIVRLQAENIALQSLVMGLLNSLVTVGNGKLAEGAFYYADTVLEAGAIHLGANAPREHTIGAIEVLEQLRAALVAPPEHRPEG